MHAPFAEVVEALIGEGVVVPLPRELGLDESPGRQALHGLDDLQVDDIEVLVLWCVEVLLGDKNTLYCSIPQSESAGHGIYSIQTHP